MPKKLIPMVELHSSLWLDDMKNYTVNDFIGLGLIATNPFILKGSDDVLLKLSMAQWNVIPMPVDFIDRKLALKNYIYLYDTNDGLDIYHHEPL